ncbi:MAG TPA: TonB family protein [Polyangia bacterium]|jgi:TonB family protein
MQAWRLCGHRARALVRAAILSWSLVLIAAAPAVAGPSSEAVTEPPITVPGSEGDYLRAIHTRIHERWAGFVDGLSQIPAIAGPVGDKSSRAVVLFAVRWDGTVAEANVVTSSGVAAFDRASVDAVRTAERFPVPPVDIFSDDGIVHFRWTFAAQGHLCADGQLIRREDPLEEALPRLFIQSRTKEALLRVKRRMDANAGGDPMALFARAYLARPNIDPVANVEAAAVLARLGDARQIDRLSAGLAFPVTAGTAVPALHALKVDICPSVQPRLLGGDAPARLLAASELRDTGDALPEQSPCAQALAAIASDGKQPGNVRAVALQTLGALSEPTAHRLWPTLIKESDALVRAAAVSASAHPGGGRAALYRLIPFLHDPSVDVRAAAAAAMVRSAGELALDQLPGALKDPDPRIAVALSAALGHLPTPAAAAMLGRLAKRDAVDVRVAAAQALAARADQPARALLAPILEAAAKDPHAPPALRQLVKAPAGAAVASELQARVSDADFGLQAFRGLLTARKHTEAADVLVTEFDRLPPRVLISFLGAWLELPPSATARVSTAAPEPPPAADQPQP